MSQTIYRSIRINGKLYNENNLHELNAEPDLVNFIREWLDGKDYIDVLTSGTTGKPKKISLNKQHMINSAKLTLKFFGLTSENTALLCLPVRYIAGKMMVIRALVSGLDLIVNTPSSTPLYGLNNSFDFVAMTPHQLFLSIKEIERLKIKTIIVGGSEISTELEKMIKTLKTSIYATYGMTETCSHIAIRKINGENAQETFEGLDTVKFQKDNRDCLVISAPQVADSIIKTNDVVDLIDKHHFKWLGRFDNVINTGGLKVFPEVIEKKISGLIDQPYFVGPLPDVKFSERIVLFIEGNPPDYKEELIERLKKCLLNYEIPKEIIYVNKFNYSQTGKLLRKDIINSVNKY